MKEIYHSMAEKGLGERKWMVRAEHWEYKDVSDVNKPIDRLIYA
jgi:hypothetical protein